MLIGLDLGTTNCKAVVLAADGHVAASASSSYSLQSPRPGWAAQDVHEAWQGVVKVLRAVASKVGRKQISGLCLSGAMHSLFPVDKAGIPLALAMTWADNRAAAYVPVLRTQTDPYALYRRTGCPLRSTYHSVRLRWWLKEAAPISRDAFRFIAIKDWVLHRLTGIWATDLSLASTTGLLDLESLDWDKEALDLAGVTAEQLPPIVSPTAILGGLTQDAADETSLPRGLPVIAGACDGGLANLGAGAVSPGQVVVSIGTSGAIRKIVERPQFDPNERTWCYILVEGHWFAGGSINNGGLALQWIRERFYPDLSAEAGYEQLLNDAAAVPAGAEGVLVLPYFSGERNPHWNPTARAVICGLTLEHTRAHVARAALEGIAFCLADVWEALAGEVELQEPARLSGAITRSPEWIRILADVLGISLVPVKVADASALGAAILGHWALGNIKTLGIRTIPRVTTIFEPDAEKHAFYTSRHRTFQSLYQVLDVGFFPIR
ncbi:MAG: gluconokinase [Anaerolineae bacterium]